MEEEQKAMLYRNPDAFIDNWVTLIWKGHDPNTLSFADIQRIRNGQNG